MIGRGANIRSVTQMLQNISEKKYGVLTYYKDNSKKLDGSYLYLFREDRPINFKTITFNM
jgi:hypothetical protein